MPRHALGVDAVSPRHVAGAVRRARLDAVLVVLDHPVVLDQRVVVLDVDAVAALRALGQVVAQDDFGRGADEEAVEVDAAHRVVDDRRRARARGGDDAAELGPAHGVLVHPNLAGAGVERDPGPLLGVGDAVALELGAAAPSTAMPSPTGELISLPITL